MFVRPGSTDSSSSSSSDEEEAIPPTKKPCVNAHDYLRKQLQVAAAGSTRKSEFTWLEYDAHCDGAFSRCLEGHFNLEQTGGVWTTKLSKR